MLVRTDLSLEPLVGPWLVAGAARRCACRARRRRLVFALSVQLAEVANSHSHLGNRRDTKQRRRRVSPSLAQALSRTTEHRGAYVRLDLRGLPANQSLSAPDPVAGELFQCMPWIVHRSWRHRHSAHVNLQELEEICEVRGAVRHSLEPQRMVNGVDSLVCLGTWCKGRSSSTQINRLLRRILPWRVFGRMSLENLHMCSQHNPADAPCRLKPLPPHRAPEP